jgi:hypothetical protein
VTAPISVRYFLAAASEDLRRRPLGPARLRGAIQLALRRMRHGAR